MKSILSCLVLVLSVMADEIVPNAFNEELEILLFYEQMMDYQSQDLFDDTHFMIQFDKRVDEFVHLFNLSAFLPSLDYFGSGYGSAFTHSKKYWYLDMMHHFSYQWDHDVYVGDIVLAGNIVPPVFVTAATITAFVYDKNEQYAVLALHNPDIDIKQATFMHLFLPNRDWAFYRVIKEMDHNDALYRSKRKADNYKTHIGIVHRSIAKSPVDCALAAIKKEIITHPQEIFVYKDKKPKQMIKPVLERGKAKCIHSFFEFEGDILDSDDVYVHIALPKHVTALVNAGASGMHCVTYDGTELMFINRWDESDPSLSVPHIRTLKLRDCLGKLGEWGLKAYSRQVIKGGKECYSFQECYEQE
eukprot:78628_1